MKLHRRQEVGLAAEVRKAGGPGGRATIEDEPSTHTHGSPKHEGNVMVRECWRAHLTLKWTPCSSGPWDHPAISGFILHYLEENSWAGTGWLCKRWLSFHWNQKKNVTVSVRVCTEICKPTCMLTSTHVCLIRFHAHKTFIYIGMPL